MRVTKTHVYFWGSIFSQWYACSFTEEDIAFSSAEQYMMYHKALLFNDVETAKKILATEDPKLCKQYGREVKNFDSVLWDKEKFNIVVNGNYLKFSQNSFLRKQLLETKDLTLVEGSPHDTIWGVGLHYNDNFILDERNWKGENLLGKALMEVRTKLIK